MQIKSGTWQSTPNKFGIMQLTFIILKYDHES